MAHNRAPASTLSFMESFWTLLVRAGAAGLYTDRQPKKEYSCSLQQDLMYQG